MLLLQTFLSCLSQLRILVQFYHLLDNGIGLSIQENLTLAWYPRVVPAPLQNPLFFTHCKLPHELTVIFANNSPDRIEVPVSDVVCSLGDLLWLATILTVAVRDERHAIRAEVVG